MRLQQLVLAVGRQFQEPCTGGCKTAGGHWGGGQGRDALEGKEPQRRPQKR